MALHRSPLTVTLWPSSFLKKYGPMIPPAHKAHQTVSFSGFNGVSTYTCGLASLQMRQFCFLSKGRIEAFTTGSPHTNTIVITAEIESEFVALDDLVHSAAVQFLLARHHSKRACRWVGTRNGRRDPKCPSSRHLRKDREDTEASSEGATCAWIAADEAVGCTRAFLTMWRSSRRLVCRRRPESGFHVNEISRIHWSQHLLTTQSDWPNWRATRLSDHPASIMPIILPLSNCDSCSYCLRKRPNDMSTSALPL
ncbi:uncharacterized protein TNCV_2463481 [Trichonephila clavipes]|nr:uncharacterized protein TNCV_2463481 [Trichonephila clavipes]